MDLQNQEGQNALSPRALDTCPPNSRIRIIDATGTRIGEINVDQAGKTFAGLTRVYLYARQEKIGMDHLPSASQMKVSFESKETAGRYLVNLSL